MAFNLITHVVIYVFYRLKDINLLLSGHHSWPLSKLRSDSKHFYLKREKFSPT